MEKSRIDATSIAAALLACTLGLTLLSGPFVWLASVAGLIILLILFAYDQEGYRSLFQSLAFAAVCGFCLTLASAIFFKLRAGGAITPADPQIAGIWLPLTCAFGTLIFWVVDRARMSGRQESMSRYLRQELASPPVEHVGEQPAFREPIPAQPTSVEASPVPPPSAQPTLVRPVSEATRAPLQPIIAPAGKEAMVYVTLVGEGLNVMRSVRAEHLGRDFYKIVEPMPEGETWEYQPGQVVRCRKKNLSSGKALVAVEEAPRAS